MLPSPKIRAQPTPEANVSAPRRRLPPSVAEQKRRRAWGIEQGTAVRDHWQLKKATRAR